MAVPLPALSLQKLEPVDSSTDSPALPAHRPLPLAMPSDDWHRVSNQLSSDIAMKSILLALTGFLSTAFRHHVSLQLEVVALRHQLAVYQRTCRRPRISPTDRILWSYLARVWPSRREHLFLVKPSTLVAWQRKRFRDHWRRMSQSGTPGRPALTKELRELIRRMSRANPTWAARAIARNFHEFQAVSIGRTRA